MTNMEYMFAVRVSARLLLLLRCLLTGLCITWMSRRSLDTAIRPWMHYCRVPLTSTSPSVTWDTSSVTTMEYMFDVCVSARLLLLLRCLLTGLCIPWMSRRSLDTAIRPWMHYCSVPLPSTKTCLAGVSTRTSSHARTSPSACQQLGSLEAQLHQLHSFVRTMFPPPGDVGTGACLNAPCLPGRQRRR